ncbi:lysylphosphatidylglycerol synthase transmembrane domain-containing protein [soil metagenome]
MKPRDLLLYGVVLAFAAWCLLSFRADISQISLDAVWSAKSAIALATLLSLLNYLLRIVRWRFYLDRLGHHLPTGFLATTYLAGFAFTLSPGKIGEMARARYYNSLGVPLSTTAAAFFVERLMDLLAMTTLALFAFAVSARYEMLLWITTAMMILILAAVARGPWATCRTRVDSNERLPLRLRKSLSGIFQTLVTARALLHPGLLMAGFLLGLAAWASEGVGLMVLGSLASSAAIDLPAAIGIYAVAIIVGALSFLPGGLGSTEAAMVALLAAHGYSMPDALLLTLSCRVLTLWLAVAIGWIAVFVLRRRPQSTPAMLREIR